MFSLHMLLLKYQRTIQNDVYLINWIFIIRGRLLDMG